MAEPTVEGCMTYLGADTSWTEAEVTSAFDSEKASQARTCRVPVPTAEVPAPDWDPALIEALYRRVAHNLAVRALPLGLQATLTESYVSTTRVGGLDAEVRRLEAPFKRLVCG
ncbi:MAG: hypothetical protein H5T76_14490 [Streptomyces sp.]|nr:hypothetical protein [Streptomyces sp.]